MVHFDRIETKNLYKLMDDTMPAKMIAVHAFVGRSSPAVGESRPLSPPGKKTCQSMPSDPFTVVCCRGDEPMSSLVLDMILPLIKQIAGKRFRLRNRFHTGTYEQMLLQLGPFGLAKENLCEAIGGALSVTDCQSLLDDVIRETTAT
jgi:hypothetical protein